jgi:hypothetical protein
VFPLEQSTHYNIRVMGKHVQRSCNLPITVPEFWQAHAKELHSIGMVKSIEKERNPLISSFICIKKKLKSKNEI